ncbi:amino acid ABC transporter substrate-binding protein [Aerococcaceae bacterium DSM 111022]|nr:amino acid ABC transporter substrate-binding protein [Aerococcaceae bacterium DSM 111022]
MKSLKKLIISMAAVTLASPVVTAEASTLQEIQDKGEIVVGMNAEFAPFEWVEMIDGSPEYQGIDIDLAQLIADELDVELVIDNRSFDGLIPALNSKRIDAIISGMSYTEEREKQVDFSIPYYNSQSRFAVQKDADGEFTSIEDFNGKRVGVLRASVQETYLKENYPEIEIVSIPANGDLLESLKANKVDAILMDEITLYQFENNYADDMTITDLIVTFESDGIAVAMTKDNEGLTEEVNQIIEQALEDGTIDQIFEDNLEKAQQ